MEQVEIIILVVVMLLATVVAVVVEVSQEIQVNHLMQVEMDLKVL